MIERLHFLVVYVGSAAMVAFLAACLSSPRVATFACDSSGANGAQQCELAETLAVVAAASDDADADAYADAKRRGADAAVALSQAPAAAH